MANRTTYRDHGLVFAKQDADLQKPTSALGQPCLSLAAWQFRQLIKAADGKRVCFHALRHTSATLLILAGEAVHTVAQRLGHSDVSMTLKVYAHVLPSPQREAAVKLGVVLYGVKAPLTAEGR